MTEDRYTCAVLRLLYERGALTRKQIMDCLNLRLNSLVAICNHLEATSDIQRLMSDRVRNVPLGLNTFRFGVIGIEHARDHAVCVLLAVDGRKHATESYVLDPAEGGAARLERLLGIIEDFRKRHSEYDIVGLGFADIGIVDTERGLGVYSAHIPSWSGVAIGEALQERFGLFNRVVDRTGASALDQLRLRPGDESVRDSLQVYVGAGVGATILQGGKYWGASSPSSCQLGHTIVVPHGERCRCGNRGCLETVVSIPAIVKRVSHLTHGAIATEEQFFHESRREDSRCLKVLAEAGEVLGIAIANVITFTAVTNVMVRSRLCQASPVFFRAMEKAVRENVIGSFRERVRVSVNHQDDDCTALGAAYYTQREYFRFEGMIN